MKLPKLALSAALISALLAGHAVADDLVQPTSVYSATFDYCQDDSQPSPSDLPVQPAPQVQPQARVSTGAGCTSGCASNNCASNNCSSNGCSSNSCSNRGSNRGCSSCGCQTDACGCSSGLGLGLACMCSDGCEYKLFNETCSGINVGGWASFGYHDESTMLFNNRPDQLAAHQMWLFAEKVADGGDCCWDWGFRADLMYGLDAQDTQAFGNNPGNWDFQNGFDHGSYGWALPQLYVEADRGDLNVKAGHFYTIAGYETVGAPGNFFYSHSYTMVNSEPFTHTGVLATYSVSDCLDVYAGWTLGWDTGFDQLGNGSSFLGGFSYDVNDDTSLTYITTFGDLGWRGDGYSHSIVIDTQLSCELQYVLQSDLVQTDGGVDQVGINQYLFYDLNDCWKAGGRVEWWKSSGQSSYEVTGGLNWFVHPNVTVRPEVRHQWVPGLGTDQTILACDAIFTF
jgi:hypothetical protein